MWVASVYAVFSVFVARISVLNAPNATLANRIFLTWILLVPASILLQPGFTAFALAAIVLALFKPADPIERIVYFLGVLPAMVDRYSYHVPFPGVGFLIELTYFKTAVIVLLLPIAFASARALDSRDRSTWRLIDSCVVAFVIYVAVLSLRETSVTNMLRILADHFISIAVPYFAVTRLLTTTRAVNMALWGFYFMAVITGWVVLVETVIQWEFYRINIVAQRFFRNDLIRISTTVNTASVCTLMVGGILIGEYFRRRQTLAGFQVWLLHFLFLAAIYFTGNRGGMLQIGIALVIMFALTKLSARARKFFTTTALIGGLSVAGAWSAFDWASIDSSGTTFQFRADLIDASIPVFLENPLLGRHDYTESPHFDHLDQSHRIVGEDRFIDMANWYLSTLLLYGLVGLVLFAYPLVKVTRWLYVQLTPYDARKEEHQLYLCLLCMLVSFLVVIGTTSGISYIPMFATTLLALGRALMGLERSPLPASA